MPTNYTPVPGNAPATITLPSDLDDADAESVNLAFRAIADNLMGLAALKAAANVFTLNQQEVSNNDASTPAWVVNKDAGSGGDAANMFKNILEAKIANMSGRVRFYSGRTTGVGHAIFTINAAWDTTNHRWFADDTGFDSIGLQFEQGMGIRLASRAPGAGTWTDWSTLTLGDITAGRHVFAGDHLVAGGDCNVGNDLNCTNAVIAGTTVTATGAVRTGSNFNFLSAPTTSFPVSIFDAIGVDDGSGSHLGFLLNYDTTGLPYLKGSGSGKIIEVAFKVPVGGNLTKAEIMADVTGDLVGFCFKRSGFDWGAPGLPSETQLGGTIGVIGSGGGLAVYSSGSFSESVARANEYRVSFHASTGAKIYGLRVTCSEPGPRN